MIDKAFCLYDTQQVVYYLNVFERLNDIAIIYFHADLCEYLHGISHNMFHTLNSLMVPSLISLFTIVAMSLCQHRPVSRLVGIVIRKYAV